MAEHSVDLAVIGGGPGGYTAAFYAADKGLSVALIDERATLGGVCLNVGCIPSKALLHLAMVREEAEHASEHGISFASPTIDLAKVRAFKEGVVGKMTSGLDTLAKARKVARLTGKARFTDAFHISVEGPSGTDTVTFKHALIATGSRPLIPKPFDLKHHRVMDSTGALEVKDIPGELLIVGGGVIGLEMGNVYAAFGSVVTVVEALPQLAMACDRDLFRPLENRLKKLFADIFVNSKVESMKIEGEKVSVSWTTPEGPREKKFDRVLLSIGRRPNTDGLDLEKAGLAPTDKGFVTADKQMRTAVSHIYAIGDVIGNPMLAHKASAEGKIAVEVMLGQKSEWDKKGIPAVMYTNPEVAWVGLTEQEAKEKNIPVKIGKFPWAASGRNTAMGRSDGLTKILFDPETERVLGVGMAGVNAGELIATGGLAVEMGAVMEDIAGTIHAHPTISETFMESAESLHGVATHIFAGKK